MADEGGQAGASMEHQEVLHRRVSRNPYTRPLFIGAALAAVTLGVAIYLDQKGSDSL